jgi:hypothetical protein
VKLIGEEMVTKEAFFRIGLLSLLLSMIGFVLDLDERVQDVKTNVFEIAMMTALCFGIISVFYFPIRVLIHKLAKKNFKSPLNSKGEK